MNHLLNLTEHVYSTAKQNLTYQQYDMSKINMTLQMDNFTSMSNSTDVTGYSSSSHLLHVEPGDLVFTGHLVNSHRETISDHVTFVSGHGKDHENGGGGSLGSGAFPARLEAARAVLASLSRLRDESEEYSPYIYDVVLKSIVAGCIAMVFLVCIVRVALMRRRPPKPRYKRIQDDRPPETTLCSGAVNNMMPEMQSENIMAEDERYQGASVADPLIRDVTRI